MSNSILFGFNKKDLERTVRLVIDEVRKTEIIESNSNLPKEDRLTQKEAAQFLGISVTSLIAWKKKGHVPYFQIGRSIFFSKSELLALARKNKDLLKSTRK